MSLAKFWPSDQNCLDCIKPEAENPADWVFLAVHQKMTFRRSNFVGKRSEVKSENQLLTEFLRDDPSGRVILPVLGESGIGKSHVIRWLDVKLRQLPDAEKRHVIRIPKSSSLKSVLGLILKDLKGKRYDDIRRQLKAAREQMDAITAKQRIRAEVLTAIEKKATQAKQNIAKARETGATKNSDDELWHSHGNNRYLPAIFGDAATAKMFMEGTKSRPGIFAELARHLTVDTGEADRPRRQFEEADFIVPKELENEITTEAGPLARKYLQRLAKTNGRDRKAATDLLNEIVDDAISPLATPADTSLSELFYDVRRQLLAEGRELVLLVEDFAVLAGIQKALLDAMIREAVVSGRAEACVMRTALAVTLGYFEQFETVRTRAVYGWYIDEVPEDDEPVTIDRMCDFFGAYLNAARIGADGLHEHYNANKGQKQTLLNFSADVSLDDDTRQQLEAFGNSPYGHALFPLNREAVVKLADWKLRDDERRLKFNPRSLLNDVLLPILREYRVDYESGQFPPEKFLGFNQSTVELTLRREVSDIVSDQLIQSRLLTLLCFWGANPPNVAATRLPGGVYEAFGLPTLDGAPTGPTPPERPPVKPTPTPPISKEAVEPPNIVERIKHLEEWRTGGTLPHREANELRKLIRDHMLEWVDWDAAFLSPASKSDVNQDAIYLPNSKGGINPPDDALVVVSTDDDFSDAVLASRIDEAMRGLLRYDHYKTWDYPNSERDYAAYANFFSSRVEAASNWLWANYKRTAGDPVPAITEALLWSGRLLNVKSAHAADDASLVAAVVADTEHVQYGNEEPWDRLRSECQEHRRQLREELLDRISARQGGGEHVFAIDVTQVLPIVKELNKQWALTHPYPVPYKSDEVGKLMQFHVKGLARYGNGHVQKWQIDVIKQSRSIRAAIGEQFDKARVAAHLKDAAALAKQFGIRGDVTSGRIESLLEEFQLAPVVECLEHIRKIEETDDVGVLLSSLAQLDTLTLELVKQFVENASTFIKQTKAEAQTRIGNWSDDVVTTEKNAVDALFAELQIITGTSLEGGP